MSNAAAGPVVLDLGVLEGPVLVFGGPYSNFQATRAILALAEEMGLPPARRICTGDMIGYCADPRATAEAVMGATAAVVAGNCERQLAAGAPDCGCGFDEGSACAALSRGWYAHARAALSGQEALLAAFAALPDIVIFTHAGRRCAVIHGGVSDISRFLWPSSPEAEFAEEISLITAAAGPVDRVIAGHCGLAFHRRVGGVDWINPGVVGLPPHDGRPLTRYAVLDGSDGVVFERLAYAHEAAARAMEKAGLGGGYAETLRSGLWPSEEVLPGELRHRP
ncbi:Calcineurin-like phosphoesterase superfamily domain-containing protein [Meinhardsimonia xiamenensis]|jgi:predicted phosphodiesterase|uniref:Calcineurin-like phosphoesterase superfamily domain-containing protein n=1 Tax=Meinhardsimonia xiamenensis TaxID=990712 RepID=A0A1G9BBS7_9RHOB|nr:metallophosphoesterase family protein [Meinhardsimonia xiamenensis]PRX35039.1 calcineurin-like phosphoesterase family protein [Meinhardsimonia xiamenensis]SDK36909.1 Calcineurin-like phosphoesterase superfamily domain-containing protein [Meinhardsimonia xiamenensis]